MKQRSTFGRFSYEAIVAKVKSPDRAAAKVDADYGGKWNKIGDLLRSTIAVDKAEDVPKVIETLRSTMEEHGYELSRPPKDRFANPTVEGYRDVLLNVKSPSGHIAEVQVNLKPMLEAKKRAHGAYAERAALNRKSATQKLSPEEDQRSSDLLDSQIKDYGTAWEDAQKEP